MTVVFPVEDSPASRILDLIVEKGMDRVLPRSNTEWITTPPQCMPDEYKHEDYITAYKQYYIGEKKRFAKYTAVDIPHFMC